MFKAIKDCEIHHIGSTAILGLGGKGIIDIMIGMKSWKEIEKTIRKLKVLGFIHIHPKEKGRIFLSKDKTLSLSNVHVHIVKTRSKAYKELLYFRDFLRKNKKEAERYFNLKLKWLKQSRGNRNKYNKLKEKYVKEVFKKIDRVF